MDIKIIRSGEEEEKLVRANGEVAFNKKFTNSELEIVNMYLYTGRILHIDAVGREGGVKTYYIVKGRMTVLSINKVLTEGDLLVFNDSDEMCSLRAEMPTEILVHSKHVEVYDTLFERANKLDGLMNELEKKDNYTKNHCINVTTLVKELAVMMGYTGQKLNDIIKAAVYHDLGKLFVPDRILNKPGKLTNEEFEIMKNHVYDSKELIVAFYNKNIFEIVSQHHERIDGSGYPYGLKDDEILEEAKILAVCDSFDAMTSNRVYDKARSLDEAVNELRSLAGIKYDRKVVSIFIEMIKDFKLVSEDVS